MRHMRHLLMRVGIPTVLFFLASHVCMSAAAADQVRVAVASNFLGTMNDLARNFQADTAHTVVISSGSSGKLYAQIHNGAPFDVFFSADQARPQMLEEEGRAVKGSRFVYALGRLTLWSPDPELVKGDGYSVLQKGRFQHIAMANPKTAPYGKAAKQTLDQLNLWDTVKDRVVQGENVTQAFQFVYTNNAQLGFVALAQVLDPKIQGTGSRWDVPPAFHDPLEQAAVLLIPGQQNTAAEEFLGYVQGEKGRSIIERFGYGLL